MRPRIRPARRPFVTLVLSSPQFMSSQPTTQLPTHMTMTSGEACSGGQGYVPQAIASTSFAQETSLSNAIPAPGHRPCHHTDTNPGS